MADQQSYYPPPSEPALDTPEFSQHLLARIKFATGGTQELTATTRKIMAESKRLLAEVDRILAKR